MTRTMATLSGPQRQVLSEQFKKFENDLKDEVGETKNLLKSASAYACWGKPEEASAYSQLAYHRKMVSIELQKQIFDIQLQLAAWQFLGLKAQNSES